MSNLIDNDEEEMIEVVLDDIVTMFYAENAEELVKDIEKGDTVLIKAEVGEATYQLISIQKVK